MRSKKEVLLPTYDSVDPTAHQPSHFFVLLTIPTLQFLSQNQRLFRRSSSYTFLKSHSYPVIQNYLLLLFSKTHLLLKLYFVFAQLNFEKILNKLVLILSEAPAKVNSCIKQPQHFVKPLTYLILSS